MASSNYLPLINPVLSMDVYVRPNSNKDQEMWVKRDLRFDGALLVCLEDKKVHPTSFMEMSPTTNSMYDTSLSDDENSTIPPIEHKIKNTEHLRTCLVATPEDWFSYLTGSNAKDKKGRTASQIKYFKVPLWTVHVSQMAGIFVPDNLPTSTSSKTTLPFTFIVKTLTKEEYVIRTQSSMEWSTWTFILRFAHTAYLRSRAIPALVPTYQSPVSLKKASIQSETLTSFSSSSSSSSSSLSSLATSPASTNSRMSIPSPKFTPFKAEKISEECFFNPTPKEPVASLADRRNIKISSLHFPTENDPLPRKIPPPLPTLRRESVIPEIRLLSPEPIDLL